MANAEHLRFLARGKTAWNEWRRQHRHGFFGEEAIDLSGADLRQFDLRELYLSGVDLSGACLAKVALQGALLHRTTLHAADLSGASFRQADCSNSEFSDANMAGVDLSYAKFDHTLFRNTNLNRAHGTGISFVKAKFLGASLQFAELNGSELFGADFTDSDLRWARIFGSSAKGSNWMGAQFAWTVCADVDLRGAEGLADVRHFGPSTIGIDTVCRSAGSLPEEFLRGSGAPETFVAYAHSLVGKPIQYYSCFISYAFKDQPFADLIYKDLQARGVRCWFAPHDVQGGKKLHEQIDEAIHVFDRLLLILSESSMSSEWVKTEIANARRREVSENRQMLFPIGLAPYDRIREWKAFDADTGKDSAREIREYFIPDFSNWQDHDSYQARLLRLVKDLKTEPGRRVSAV
jgi:hypothetical protein